MVSGVECPPVLSDPVRTLIRVDFTHIYFMSALFSSIVFSILSGHFTLKTVLSVLLVSIGSTTDHLLSTLVTCSEVAESQTGRGDGTAETPSRQVRTNKVCSNNASGGLISK